MIIRPLLASGQGIIPLMLAGYCVLGCRLTIAELEAYSRHFMKCPKCSSEMVEGRTHIGGGATTFFLGGGLSFGNLTFKASGWKDHIVQETSDVLPAHYCDRCGAVTVETTRIGLSTLQY